MLMLSEYQDAIIFSVTIFGWWLLHRAILGIKAKAFNDGYKRGRASINVREIVK
jgi:hypothetical protein